MAGMGPKRKCKRFRAAIRFKTNQHLRSASAPVQLGHVMNGAPNEPQQLQLENNSITHRAGDI